jgi:hypothetical protein
VVVVEVGVALVQAVLVPVPVLEVVVNR